MMQELWRVKPKLSYSEEVIDIIQFGSSLIKENPNDIDIAVIYQKIPLDKQLEESQKIKKQLQKISNIPIHINSYDLYSFFDKGNFANSSILFYGKSIVNGDYFSKYFGLTPRIQIAYFLNNLEKKDKVRFNYLLSGKKGDYGLLREYGGRLVSPGIIEIFPEHEKIFVDSISKITSNFKLNKIFLPE